MKFAADTPIHPASFLQLTDAERMALVEEIREKRAKPIREFYELQARLRERKKLKLEEEQEQRLKQCVDLINADHARLEKLLKYVKRCRAIELELEEP